MMLNDEMLRYIEEHSREAYELLLTLARIPAPSNHEEKRAEFCREWLGDQGAKGVYVDEALNVVYPVDVREGEPVEVYMAHTDVVFPDEEELPLKVEDGRGKTGNRTVPAVWLWLYGLQYPPVPRYPQRVSGKLSGRWRSYKRRIRGDRFTERWI